MIQININKNYKCNKNKFYSYKGSSTIVWYFCSTSCLRFRNFNLRRSYKKKNHSANLYKNKSRGQATIEFVLIFPIIIIIIIGVSQLGFYMYCKNILAYATREGARVLATTNSNSLAIQQIYKNCNGLETQMLDIYINPFSDIDRAPGDFVTIDISYKYRGFGDFLTNITDRDVCIKDKCLMRMECGN